MSTLMIGTAAVNFSAATADYFGIKNLGLNYGLIFNAWGVGGVLGPLFGAVLNLVTTAPKEIRTDTVPNTMEV